MGEEKRLPDLDFSEFAPTTYDEWKASAVAALKDASFEKSMFTRTYEGITLEPLYTRDHTELPKFAKTMPGEPPMLRGVSAGGYPGRPWEIAQDATSASADETASVLRHDIDRGATTVTFALDGEGRPVASARDAETILAAVDAARHPFHVYAGAHTATLGYFRDAASKLGIPSSDLSGCIGTDPIGACLERGGVRDFARLFDEMADHIHFARENAPKLRTILLRGAVYHNGGANAAQEVAWAMANAIELICALQERGLDIDDFARRVRFEFSIGSNFFMEMAKIRAARVVWSRVAEEFSGHDRDPETRKANIFGRTSRFTKTAYDPYVNMLRNSTEAFSAVLGGVDGLTVGCFDEAVRPADEFSRRVARNSQIMLKEEFHLLRPIDPAGGSWYIESLTDSLAQKIWDEIRSVQSKGGMLACAKSGYIQAATDEVLRERFKRLATRADRAVGTNMYPNLSEAPLPNSTRLSAKKPIAAAKEAEIAPIPPHRWTEQFEELRARTEEMKSNGSSVRIFLANMGPVPQHKARADFITGFMEVAGFEILKNDGFKTTDACAEAAAASGADIAVICSTDATYPELVPDVAKSVKEKAPSMKVYLAGAPAEEFKQAYIDAGVDGFISIRSNCLDVLSEIQKEKGMKR